MVAPPGNQTPEKQKREHREIPIITWFWIGQGESGNDWKVEGRLASVCEKSPTQKCSIFQYLGPGQIPKHPNSERTRSEGTVPVLSHD